MTIEAFANLQRDLMYFGPILFWWLVALLAGGIFMAIYINVLYAVRGMMDRWKV
jgi:hypothetical protein